MRVTQNNGLVIGVDTHRDIHTAAVCDRTGQALAMRQFSADPGRVRGSAGLGPRAGCGL